jgi:hypothetical protein
MATTGGAQHPFCSPSSVCCRCITARSWPHTSTRPLPAVADAPDAAPAPTRPLREPAAAASAAAAPTPPPRVSPRFFIVVQSICCRPAVPANQSVSAVLTRTDVCWAAQAVGCPLFCAVLQQPTTEPNSTSLQFFFFHKLSGTQTWSTCAVCVAQTNSLPSDDFNSDFTREDQLLGVRRRATKSAKLFKLRSFTFNSRQRAHVSTSCHSRATAPTQLSTGQGMTRWQPFEE